MNGTVLIAGAGLGGLTTAIALAQAGYRVRVFERAAELAEVGAGIQLSANATRILHRLGVLDELLPLSGKESTRLRMFDSGEDIVDFPVHDHEQVFGFPYLRLHRADLHDALLRRLDALSPGAIALESRASRFAEDSESVTLFLENGQSARGDLLVGADGLKSAIRRQIHGEDEPNWTGNIAWRALVPCGRLPEGFAEDGAGSLFAGPGKHCAVYFLRGGELVNFVGVVESEPRWRTESMTCRAPWEELKADFEGWHEKIQQLVDGVDKDQCYRWALYDRPPIDNWSTGRATLLGDAAHATLPFLASGAAMALEDAWILLRCLRRESRISEALRRYQRNRLQRTAAVQKRSAENGHAYHARTAGEIRARVAGRIASDESRNFMFGLYGYDALTVELA